MAILALATREMHAYLQGDQERVVVLHCKGSSLRYLASGRYTDLTLELSIAGKGRTGTLAIAYLLAIQDIPTPPKLQRSYTRKEWAKIAADSAIESVLAESWDLLDGPLDQPRGDLLSVVPARADRVPDRSAPLLREEASTSQESLEAALSLHTSRRMKPIQKDSMKPKQGGPSFITIRWV